MIVAFVRRAEIRPGCCLWIPCLCGEFKRYLTIVLPSASVLHVVTPTTEFHIQPIAIAVRWYATPRSNRLTDRLHRLRSSCLLPVSATRPILAVSTHVTTVGFVCAVGVQDFLEYMLVLEAMHSDGLGNLNSGSTSSRICDICCC